MAKEQDYVVNFAARHNKSDQQRFSVSQIQIRQCEHNIQFGSLFSQTSGFPISKSVPHHCKDVFNFTAYR